MSEPNRVIKKKFLNDLKYPWQKQVWELHTSPDYQTARETENGEIEERLHRSPFFTLVHQTCRALTLFCHVKPKYSTVIKLCEDILSENKDNLVALTLLAISEFKLMNRTEADTYLKKVSQLYSSNREQLVAELTLNYLTRKFELLKYGDAFWALRSLQDDEKKMDIIAGDVELSSYVDFHTGLFVFRVLNTWPDVESFRREICRGDETPVQLINSARQALKRAADADTGYTPRCLITLVEMNTCLLRRNAPARPFINQEAVDKRLNEAATSAEVEQDESTLGRVAQSFLKRKKPNKKFAMSCINKSLEIFVSLTAITMAFEQEYRDCLKEYLETNTEAKDREMKRLHVTDVHQLLQRLIKLNFTPYKSCSTEALPKMKKILEHLIHDLKTKKQLGEETAIRLAYFIGELTLQEADERFVGCLRESKTAKMNSFIYLRWSGCYRALPITEFHAKYETLLWESVRLAPPMRYPSASHLCLYQMTAQKRGDAQGDASKMKNYYEEMGEINLLMNQKQEAIDLLEPALRTDPSDAELGNLLARAYSESGRIEKAIELYNRSWKLHLDKDNVIVAMKIMESHCRTVLTTLRYQTDTRSCTERRRLLLNLVSILSPNSQEDWVSSHSSASSSFEPFSLIREHIVVWMGNNTSFEISPVANFFGQCFGLPADPITAYEKPQLHLNMEYERIAKSAFIVCVKLEESMVRDRLTADFLEVLTELDSSGHLKAVLVIIGNTDVISDLHLSRDASRLLKRTLIGSELGVDRLINNLLERAQNVCHSD